MEWKDKDKYNSFNSYKGLTYYENYKNIVAWMDGKKMLQPPVEVNIDPIAFCNLECYFCIVQRYLKTHREEIGEMLRLPNEYIKRLLKFLASWGVRGICISGGGDPSLHSYSPEMIQHIKTLNMDSSFFTNAVRLPEELIDSLMLCKWISLSIDTGNTLDYQKIKGKNYFNKVVKNLARLVEAKVRTNSKVSLVFKFLILPENVKGIYQACKLAKDLGLQAIHIRPVDFQRADIKGHKALDIEVKIANEQMEKCHELDDNNFKAFTITHKFDSEFHVKHDFNKCLASPLISPMLTDGNAYLCVDKKMEAGYRLGSCYPDPENILKWWGSNEHRELIKSVDISRCSRCTISQYNRQIEEVVINDNMSLNFP